MTLDWKKPSAAVVSGERQSKAQLKEERRSLRASQRSLCESALRAERQRFAATIDYCQDAKRAAAARDIVDAAAIFERDASVALTGLKKATELVKLAVFMIQYKAPGS